MHFLLIQGTNDVDEITESTVIQIKQSKNYGSVTVPSTEQFQRLTYTWSNIDVFGEAPQQMSSYSNLSNKIKSCFGTTQRVPTPRKHLLKNMSGIAYPGEMLAVLGSRYGKKTKQQNANRKPQKTILTKMFVYYCC